MAEYLPMDGVINRGVKTPRPCQTPQPMIIDTPIKRPAPAILEDNSDSESMDTTESESELCEIERRFVTIERLESLDMEKRLREQKREMNLMDKACRFFLQESGLVDCRVLEAKRITPFGWVKFRQHLELEGKIAVNGEDFIVRKHGELLKCPSMAPICSHPSCFISDYHQTHGTSGVSNKRCPKHAGDTTSFAVVELIFFEKVLEITVAIAVEHLYLMFPHDSRKTTRPQLEEEVLTEYKSSGLIGDSYRGLLAIKFNRAASELRRTEKVVIHRLWIKNDVQEASFQFYIWKMAGLHVKKLLVNKVVPGGIFKGQHFEIVPSSPAALEGYARFNLDIRFNLSSKINDEQMMMYGTALPIKLCF